MTAASVTKRGQHSATTIPKANGSRIWAGPTGFGLYQALMAAGISCEVAAPRKLQRPAGHRVKTEPGMRFILRGCSGWTKSLPCRCRRLASRLPVTWCGHVRIVAYDAWLRRQRLETAGTQMTFESDYDTVVTVKAPTRPARPHHAGLVGTCFTSCQSTQA